MIITDKTEIFQKLLKDVDYIKSVLKFSGKYYIGCDPYNEDTKKILFKKGDWVIRTEHKDEPNHHIGRIFKILDVKGSVIYESNGITHWALSLRKATDAEIEKHLIDGAIIKGFCANRKFNWYTGKEEPSRVILPFEYNRETDALVCHVDNSVSKRAIYRQGEWAYPIFQEELPRSIKELESLICDFASRFYASDYYSDRDSDVGEFLKTKGYK